MAVLLSFCCVDTAKEQYACSNDNPQQIPIENVLNRSHLEMNCQSVNLFFFHLVLNAKQYTDGRATLKGESGKFLYTPRDWHFAV